MRVNSATIKTVASVTSNRAFNERLRSVQLDPARGTATATDGFAVLTTRVSAVPCEGQEIVMPLDMVKALPHDKRNPDATNVTVDAQQITAHNTYTGATITGTALDRYPNAVNLFTEHSARVCDTSAVINVNPALLGKLLVAISKLGTDSVALTFNGKGNALLITSVGGTECAAMCMPVKRTEFDSDARREVLRVIDAMTKAGEPCE